MNGKYSFEICEACAICTEKRWNGGNEIDRTSKVIDKEKNINGERKKAKKNARDGDRTSDVREVYKY